MLAKLGLIIIVLLTGISDADESDFPEQQTSSVIAGGPCRYKTYKGKATIVSVVRKEVRNRTAYEGYEVKFTFTPDQEIEEPHGRVNKEQFSLMLSDSTYPSSEFLVKYNIKVGQLFDCQLRVITKGTCTPIIFDFPTINLDDSSEN